MFLNFIKLEYKSLFRSASLGRDLAIKLLLSFLAIYLIGTFLVLGFNLYAVLQEVIPDKSPLEVVNGLILSWIILELFVRFFLQKLPTLNIKPLLIQPIKRSKVINYVLTKSIFSFFNLLGLLVFIPFISVCVKNGLLNSTQAAFWIISIVGFILVINFTNFLISDKFSENIKVLLPFLLLIAALYVLSYYKLINLTDYLSKGMGSVITYPALSLLPVLAGVGLYIWNFRNLKNKFFLDASLQSKITEAKQLNLGWLERFGPLAPFIKLDIKLLIRNKRPRTTLLVSLLFLFYGLVFYVNDDALGGDYMKLFSGIFMTGIFIINFGQFIPAWDSSYYSLMMSQNIPMKEYFKSKTALMNLSILILFLCSLPYAYFGYEIILIHLAAALYNAGINIPIILFFGSFNKKRIDLEKGAMLNYQGTGTAQWLMAFPILLIPMILWVSVELTAGAMIAHLVLAAVGLLGLAFNKQILNFLTQAYSERKYQALEGFQQKDA